MAEEELRAEAIEVRISNSLDRGDVDGSIIDADVVALYEDGGAGDQKEAKPRITNSWIVNGRASGLLEHVAAYQVVGVKICPTSGM
jgi:hypothetical protein